MKPENCVLAAAAVVAGLLLAAPCVPAFAQEGAKAMVANPADAHKAVSYRFQVLKNGEYQPVPADFKFPPGAKARLYLEPHENGVLTVLIKAETRHVKFFPNTQEDFVWAQKGKDIAIPLAFDNKPEDVEFFVVLAKDPGASAEWLERVKKSSKQANAEALVSALRMQSGAKGVVAGTPDQLPTDGAGSAPPPGLLATPLKLLHDDPK